VQEVARELRHCLDFLPHLLGDDPLARKY